MDPELKSKWIAALRSGEYKQIRGKMTDNAGSFCCLGVLCAVAKVPAEPSPEEEGGYPFCDVQLNGTAFGPDDLWQLNDCKRLSFPEIADWIEENL